MFQSKQRLTHLGHIGSAGEGDRVEGLGEASKLRFRRHAAVCENSETECSVSVSQQKCRKCHGILDNHSLRDHY